MAITADVETVISKLHILSTRRRFESHSLRQTCFHGLKSNSPDPWCNMLTRHRSSEGTDASAWPVITTILSQPNLMNASTAWAGPMSLSTRKCLMFILQKLLTKAGTASRPFVLFGVRFINLDHSGSTFPHQHQIPLMMQGEFQNTTHRGTCADCTALTAERQAHTLQGWLRSDLPLRPLSR